MDQDTIGRLIIGQALQFIDMYEVKNDSAWQSVGGADSQALSTEIHDTMVKCGWVDGEPYCISLAKACWLLAYQTAGAPQIVIDSFMRKICPSVMTSFYNLKPHITRQPVPGSILFFQLGGTDHGHAGIVVSESNGVIATIEGNTSVGQAASVAADRNGDGIYRKIRHLDFGVKPGLHLIGFLNPIVW